MDDLDVIRLVAMDNITKDRIARARKEVKENFGEGAEAPQAVYLALLRVFHRQSLETVFREKHLSLREGCRR
jgi:glutamate formiminotransferase